MGNVAIGNGRAIGDGKWWQFVALEVLGITWLVQDWGWCITEKGLCVSEPCCCLSVANPSLSPAIQSQAVKLQWEKVRHVHVGSSTPCEGFLWLCGLR